MPIRLPIFLICIAAAFVFAGCHTPTKEPQTVEGGLFFDYQVWGDEDKEDVTCLFQFHEDSPDGATLLLEPPSRVLLDSTTIPPDSARFSGAFYELQLPRDSFAGKHTISFTDAEGKKLNTSFNFKPIKLLSNFTGTISRKDMVIKLVGVAANDRVRVVLLDTSFADEGINELYPVRDSQIVLGEALLNKIKNGPVTLQLVKEQEQIIKRNGEEAGRLAVSYTITRDFILKD